MSERKVLNKYYPPDFDPSKIPRMKLPKNRQYTVRLMAPFNMRCKTCGEYIYRGKKFNARKEDVEGDDYCGVRIYRFYIKCTRCLQEISFKTDPRNTDYEIEVGATRNFMALKLAQEQEKREEEELKEEETNNPMKLLENRTQQSKIEIELMECLEEIKDLNRRHYNIDFNQLLRKYNTNEVREKLLEMQREKDEQFAKELMSRKRRRVVSEEIIDSDGDENESKGPIIEKENIEDGFSEDEIIFTNTITPSCSGDKSLIESKSTIPPISTFTATSIEPIIKKPVDTKSIIVNRELPSSNIPSPIVRFKNSLEGMKNIKNKFVEPSSSKSAQPKKPETNALTMLCSYGSNSDGSNSE